MSEEKAQPAVGPLAGVGQKVENLEAWIKQARRERWASLLGSIERFLNTTPEDYGTVKMVGRHFLAVKIPWEPLTFFDPGRKLIEEFDRKISDEIHKEFVRRMCDFPDHFEKEYVAKPRIFDSDKNLVEDFFTLKIKKNPVDVKCEELGKSYYPDLSDERRRRIEALCTVLWQAVIGDHPRRVVNRLLGDERSPKELLGLYSEVWSIEYYSAADVIRFIRWTEKAEVVVTLSNQMWDAMLAADEGGFQKILSALPDDACIREFRKAFMESNPCET